MIEAKDKKELKPEGSIHSVSKNDVLCGRGSGPNDHCGNVAFRDFVSARRREYLNTSTRAQKARIAREIVDVVKALNPPGRFLEKATETSWNEASEEKALEKVKQALRQMRHRRAESLDIKNRSTLQRDSWQESSHRRINSAPANFAMERATENIQNMTQNYGVSPVSIIQAPTFCNTNMSSFPYTIDQQMPFFQDPNNHQPPVKQNIIAPPAQMYSSTYNGLSVKNISNNSEDTLEPYPFHARDSLRFSSDNQDQMGYFSSIGTIEIDDHQMKPRSYQVHGKDESMDDFERIVHVLEDSESTLPNFLPEVGSNANVQSHPQYSNIRKHTNQGSRYF